MIRSNAVLDLDGNDFDGCQATRSLDGFGGGMAAMNFSTVTLSDNQFSDCTAANNGGASTPTSRTCRFSERTPRIPQR